MSGTRAHPRSFNWLHSWPGPIRRIRSPMSRQPQITAKRWNFLYGTIIHPDITRSFPAGLVGAMDQPNTPSGLRQIGASNSLIHDLPAKIFNHLFHPRRVMRASGKGFGKVVPRFRRPACKSDEMVVVDEYASVFTRYFTPVLP